MNQALIIFVRNPVLGKVKTRLARTTGAGKALEIYRTMLSYTRYITGSLNCDKYVYYADETVSNDIWEEKLYHKQVQLGNDLGQKMQRAFDDLFAKGYGAVAIIGSDNMELTSGIVASAFDALQDHEVVIGPSADGGYYLLALTRTHSCLFEHISWSTDRVLSETTGRCDEAGLAFSLLPLLHDIDDEAGWNRYQSLQTT